MPHIVVIQVYNNVVYFIVKTVEYMLLIGTIIFLKQQNTSNPQNILSLAVSRILIKSKYKDISHGFLQSASGQSLLHIQPQDLQPIIRFDLISDLKVWYL